MNYKRFFFVYFFVFLLFSSTKIFASTTDYTLTIPENKTDIKYTKNFYNEIGTLKITKLDGNETFDTNKKVAVTVKYDGKFVNSDTPAVSVDYKLVLGTSDSYTEIKSGDKIEFSAASIDNNINLTIGAVITGDTSKIKAGDYKNNINFSSVLLPVTGKAYTFGRYDGINLTWRILAVDDTNKRALLITENCVETMKYANNTINKWSQSSLKNWLNGKFLTGLTDNSKILNVKIEDNDNSDSAAIINSSGNDKIFLLSKTDAKKYFKDKSDRQANLNGAGSYVKWWLRSPVPSFNNESGFSTSNMVVVQADGGLNDDNGVGVNNTGIYVRPAIWLDISAEATEKSGTATIEFTKTSENNSNDDDNNSGSNEININPPSELDTEDLKNIPEEELKEQIGETSHVILYGDMSGADAQEVADLIEKIENVTELKILDLSNVTGITEISLPENTKLEELHIENSETLITLDISNSAIKKLNTNGCVNLESLNCSFCDIIELDIDGCGELSELNCSYNSLARLDVSALNNLNSLKCDNQNINDLLRLKEFNFVDFLFRTDSEIFAASEKDTNELEYIKDIEAVSENGSEIEINLDENTGNITFSEEPSKIIYNYDTGFENILMDVTVKTVKNSAEDKENNQDNSNSESSHSCNLSCGFFAAFYVFVSLALKNCIKAKLKS